MNFNPFLAPLVAGLDVQPDGMRLIELKKRKHIFSIKREHYKALPPAIVSEEKINDWDAFTYHLQTWVKEEGLQGLAVAVALPSRVVHRGIMPVSLHLTREDIEAEIVFYAQRHFMPYAMEWVIDYSVLAEQGLQAEIHYAITDKHYVQRYVACLEQAKLNAVSVDVDVLAIKRALPQCLSLYTDEQLWQTLNNNKQLLAFGLAMRVIDPC